jgi:hypothetical protein
MFLTETTVDAETAQPVDGTKMLVDDGCDLGVNDAVVVVEAADRLVGGHEGLDCLIELSLESIYPFNRNGSVRHLAFEALNDFLCVAHGCSFPRGAFILLYRTAQTRFFRAAANSTKPQVDGLM